VDFLVKVLQETLTGQLHGFVNLQLHLCLKGVEGGLNFLYRAAILINPGDSFLKIHTGFETAQHLVAGSEDTVKELEFLGKQLIDALVGGVALIQEIDNDNVMLLTVPMAAPNALLDPLRIPGEIIVDDKGSELKIDTLCTRFGGDHDGRFIPEVIHQSGAQISCF